MRRCANGCLSRPDEDGNRSPVLAEEPSRLCRGCEAAMAGWLDAIERSFALLPYLLQPGSTPPDPARKIRAGLSPPVPARLDVLDLLDSRRARNRLGAPTANRRGAVGVLASYADEVRELRRLSPQPHPSVPSEVRLLRRHLLFVTEQDWAPDCHADLRALARQLADAVGDYRPRPVGRCAVLGEEGACGGPLMPQRYTVGVRCARCGSTWSAPDLRRLGLILGSEA